MTLILRFLPKSLRAQNGDYYAVIRILDKDGKVVASATTAVKGFAF